MLGRDEVCSSVKSTRTRTNREGRQDRQGFLKDIQAVVVSIEALAVPISTPGFLGVLGDFAVRVWPPFDSYR